MPADIQQSLLDFDATIKAKPNLTTNELMVKFPEFNNDPKLLQSAHDYSATLNSGKYSDRNMLNSKFTEFFSNKQAAYSNTPPNDNGTLLNSKDEKDHYPGFDNQQAQKVIYGSLPGEVKFKTGATQLNTLGMDMAMTKKYGKYADSGVKSVAVPAQSVDNDIQGVKPITSTYDPIEQQSEEYYNNSNEYEKNLFNQAQEISKGAQENAHLAHVAWSDTKGMMSSVGKAILDQAAHIQQIDPYTVHNAEFNKNQAQFKQSDKDLEKWNNNDKPKLKGTFGETLAGIAPMIGMVGADFLSDGSLTPATVTAFGEMGWGEGLKAADDWGEKTNKPLTEGQREAAAVGYMLAYTLPIGKYVDKYVVKGAGTYIISKVLTQNPEFLIKSGEQIIQNLAEQSPSLAKKTISAAMSHATSGIGTMAAIDLVKMGTDKIVMGKGVSPDEFINRIGDDVKQGLAFGLGTLPFAESAKWKAIEDRRNTQKEVTFGTDKYGKAYEKLPVRKDGIEYGMKPNGEIIKLKPRQLEHVITMTTDHFNEVIKKYKDSKGITPTDPNFDRSAFSNRVAQSLKQFITTDGQIHIANVDGTQLYVSGKDENGNLVGVDGSGNIQPIPEGIPLESAPIVQVHQSIMNKWDEVNGKQTESNPTDYQKAIGNDPESIVNPTILPNVDVTDPNTHIQSGINVADAKSEMDKQLEGSGFTLNEDVNKLDPESQKQIVTQVMQDETLTDKQKQSIINYVGAEASHRKLQEADQQAISERFAQAQDGLEKLINPKSGTVVTAHIKGDDPEKVFQVKKGLAVTSDETKTDNPWMVDTENSDPAVYYLDSEGITQLTTADNLEVVSNTTPNEYLDALQNQYMQDWQQRQDIIDNGIAQYQQGKNQEPRTKIEESGDKGDSEDNAQQPVTYPTKKDGSIDFENMSDEDTFNYLKETEGEEGAVSAINSVIKSTQTDIQSNQRAIDKFNKEKFARQNKAKTLQEIAGLKASLKAEEGKLNDKKDELAGRLKSLQGLVKEHQAPKENINKDTEPTPTEIGGYKVIGEAEPASSGERIFIVTDENGQPRFLTADGKEAIPQTNYVGKVEEQPVTNAPENIQNLPETVTETPEPVQNKPNKTTKAPTPYQKRLNALGDYLDMEDYILRAIAGGQKFKWNTEGVKKGMGDELGFADKNGERLQRRNLIDEQNGITPADFAHAIFNDYGENGNNGEIPGVQDMSDHDILNVINEILNSTKSNADALTQAEAKRKNFDLSPEDYDVYTSFTPEEMNYLEDMSDDILETYLGMTDPTPEQLQFIDNLQNEYGNTNTESTSTGTGKRDQRSEGETVANTNDQVKEVQDENINTSTNTETLEDKENIMLSEKENKQTDNKDIKDNYNKESFPKSKSVNSIDKQISKQEPNITPTQGQKIAGNYKKAHVTISGMDLSVENPVGSIRTGTDPDGKEWKHEMKSHYGYFKGTTGKDGDHIAAFIKQGPPEDWNGTAYVIDQTTKPTLQERGNFDESKVMLGYDSPEEAKAAYMENYDADWKGLGDITPVSLEDFKKWLYDGAKQHKAFAEYVDTPEHVKDTETLQQAQPVYKSLSDFDFKDEDITKARKKCIPRPRGGFVL